MFIHNSCICNEIMFEIINLAYYYGHCEEVKSKQVLETPLGLAFSNAFDDPFPKGATALLRFN
jgi:hypothetical protein